MMHSDTHEFVASFNFDSGLEPIAELIDDSTTELATALLIYWRLEGPFMSELSTRANATGWALNQRVKGRIASGVYAVGRQRYYPVEDNGLSRVQVHQLKKKGVPVLLVEPDYGNEVVP